MSFERAVTRQGRQGLTGLQTRRNLGRTLQPTDTHRQTNHGHPRKTCLLQQRFVGEHLPTSSSSARITTPDSPLQLVHEKRRVPLVVRIDLDGPLDELKTVDVTEFCIGELDSRQDRLPGGKLFEHQDFDGSFIHPARPGQSLHQGALGGGA